MNISELIAELEEMMETYGDIEVRTATQPSWPFEHHIAQLKVHSEMESELQEAHEALLNAEDADERKEIQEFIDETEENIEDSRILYIVEGSQIGYTTKTLWD